MSGCTSSLSIGADGTISSSSADSALSATLSDQDLQMFASWAISQEHVDALQVDHCPPVEDGATTVTLGFRPGISISNTNGCAPAIAVVTELAQALAARYLSGSTTAAPPVPGIAHPELAAKIDWSKLSFWNLEVGLVGEIDADGTIHGPGLTAGPKLDAAMLADLQRQATSLDLVNAWPGSCAPVGTFPDLWLMLAPAIVMQTSTQGCAAGPITALEDLLSSAVATLPGASDAGADGGTATGGADGAP